MDVDNPRHVVVITIAVVAVTVVAAFGFASLSDNPLIPDATLDVRDDSDEYDLRQEGIVGVAGTAPLSQLLKRPVDGELWRRVGLSTGRRHMAC